MFFAWKFFKAEDFEMNIATVEQKFSIIMVEF